MRPDSPDGGRDHFRGSDDQGFYDQLFGGSELMRNVGKTVLQVADTNATVLIQGETGTGKERVARAVHYLSNRSTKPWLKLNCASLPADLLESELFGHDKGAFTGAAALKPGRFELADGGTFLLDEIAEMPLSLQSKILHVLQDNEFFRVGGRELISVDVRIIAATNKDLQAMVIDGTFREDLYYRLDVVSIRVPPLRERHEEIPSLVEYYRGKFMQEFGRQCPRIPPETHQLLSTYSWPGNIRELENLVKRYVALNDPKDLHETVRARTRQASRKLGPGVVIGDASPVHQHRPEPIIDQSELAMGLRAVARRGAERAERAAVIHVLDRVQWNRAEAARLLKVSYKTLLMKLDQMGLQRKSRHREPA
jgi:two-component system response regulator AtoC